MSEAIILALISGLCGLIGGAIAARYSYKVQKPVAEATALKSDAETQRIEDELTERVLTRTRGEMDRMSIKIDLLEKDLALMNRRASFFIDFARVNWTGAQSNAEYIRKVHNETPPYVPPDKFPTGPIALGAGQT